MRETDLYGNKSLKEIERELIDFANLNQSTLVTFQSNAEHEIITSIHNSIAQKVDFIVINPAAYTHTSIAIRDALLAVQIPFYEVHLSDIHSREKFRHFSYLSDIAEEVITGIGIKGYEETTVFHTLHTRESIQSFHRLLD